MYYLFVNTTVTFPRGRSLAAAFLGWGRAGSACHGGRLGTRGFVDATGDVSAHESRALIRVAVESCIIFCLAVEAMLCPELVRIPEVAAAGSGRRRVAAGGGGREL